MNNIEKTLFGTACFFGGIIAGFIISPVKKGVTIINTGGNRCRDIIGDIRDYNRDKLNKKYSKEGKNNEN